MANRHLERKVLLQTLYEWDQRAYPNREIADMLEYVGMKFNELEKEDFVEISSLAEEIAKKRVVIDEIIEKAAPAWPLEKISVTDRNVLRIGLYELLFSDREQIPPKVAINEAIELAKKFGGPKSGKFVNGVIGAVYREIGEPGKDDVGKPKMHEVPYEAMPVEQKGSAVVYSVDQEGTVRLGMVHDIFGYWTLSKGGIKDGETVEHGTARAIKEETDWSITIEHKLGENEYIAYPPEKGPTRKQVSYFLAQSPYTKPTLMNESGGLDDVRWFGLGEVADLNIYDDVSQMLIKSIELITGTTIQTETKGSPSKEGQTVLKEQNNFSDMKLDELKSIAKERGMTGLSNLKKAELIDLLNQN